jgi:hypothetical protein
MQAPIRTNNILAKKDWIKGIILVIAWILIFSLAKDLWQLKSGYSRITESEQRLADEVKKNTMLKDKLQVVMTDEYKEKIIREQLNMQKIGEVVAVLPKSEANLEINENNVEKTSQNWEKWWSLLK